MTPADTDPAGTSIPRWSCPPAPRSPRSWRASPRWADPRGPRRAIWVVAALLCRRLCRPGPGPAGPDGRLGPGPRRRRPRLGPEAAGTGDELDDLGRAFNDLLARLHLAYERQRRFTGDASHQLRTPLTVLIGQLEVALRQDRPGRGVPPGPEVGPGRAAQLRQIVEALLFLGRADAEAGPPEGEPIELAAGSPTTWPASPPGRPSGPPGAGPLRVQAHPPAGPAARQPAGQRPEVRRAGGLDPVEAAPTAARSLAVEDTGPGLPPRRRSHLRALLSLARGPPSGPPRRRPGPGRRPADRRSLRRDRPRPERPRLRLPGRGPFPPRDRAPRGNPATHRGDPTALTRGPEVPTTAPHWRLAPARTMVSLVARWSHPREARRVPGPPSPPHRGRAYVRKPPTTRRNASGSSAAIAWELRSKIFSEISGSARPSAATGPGGRSSRARRRGSRSGRRSRAGDRRGRTCGGNRRTRVQGRVGPDAGPQPSSDVSGSKLFA